MERFNEGDPLMLYLEAALLPEMEFTQARLDDVVECLRHLATRALASLVYPVPGGVSITLIAPPVCRATPINLRVALGTSLGDALRGVAAETGLDLIVGTVGVLFCPVEAGDRLVACIDQPVPPPNAPCQVQGLPRAEWLRLLAYYPVLAVSSHPLRQAWKEAFLRSDGTPQAAYRLAYDLVGAVTEEPCACPVQIPVSLALFENCILSSPPRSSEGG